MVAAKIWKITIVRHALSVSSDAEGDAEKEHVIFQPHVYINFKYELLDYLST